MLASPVFRKSSILLINAAVIAWLVKVALCDYEAGIFLTVAFCFLLAYNVYAFIVYTFFPSNVSRWAMLDIAYLSLLLLPFGLLYALS